MQWAMRYTFHSGYEPPDLRPQFVATLGTEDPVALVRYAAAQGVAGVMYPWALDRPAEEVARVAAVLAETGLSGSCVLATPSTMVFEPVWSDRSDAGRARLHAVVAQSCGLAVSLKAGVIVAFAVVDPTRELEAQRDDLVANLQDMASLAADYGLTIGVEPMGLPMLMLQTVATALDVVRRVGRANVGIVYDTAHVGLKDGALMPSFLAAYEHLVLLQFADLPGRVEPGSGTLDIVAVAAEALRRGYRGMVDLEHGWSVMSKEGEAQGLRRLQAFDADVRAAAGLVLV